MNNREPVKRNLYYTNDHEWIDFQGSVAYIGICRFKLTGIRQIHQLIFTENSTPFSQGDVVATIRYEDYLVPVHMPTDGKIISINEILLTGDEHVLLNQPEDNGWIALIVPGILKERKGLLLPGEYEFLINQKC